MNRRRFFGTLTGAALASKLDLPLKEGHSYLVPMQYSQNMVLHDFTAAEMNRVMDQIIEYSSISDKMWGHIAKKK